MVSVQCTTVYSVQVVTVLLTPVDVCLVKQDNGNEVSSLSRYLNSPEICDLSIELYTNTFLLTGPPNEPTYTLFYNDVKAMALQAYRQFWLALSTLFSIPRLVRHINKAAS